MRPNKIILNIFVLIKLRTVHGVVHEENILIASFLFFINIHFHNFKTDHKLRPSSTKSFVIFIFTTNTHDRHYYLVLLAHYTSHMFIIICGYVKIFYVVGTEC